MSGIFVNYRQNRYPDGNGEVRCAHVQVVEAIAERLAGHFGSDQVFLDTKLRLAARYPDELRDRLVHSELIIAVIHESWLEDLKDRRQRHSPEKKDWVLAELTEALALRIPVLPVLIDTARLPGKAELPDDIAELGLCQAHRIQFGHWRRDVDRLVREAERYVLTEQLPADEEPAPRPRRSWYAPVAAGAVGLLAPYMMIRLLGSRSPEQVIWLTVTAVIFLFFMLILLGMVSMVYAARRWLDGLDRQAVTLSHDLRTNVIVGLTIGGLSAMVLLTSTLFTPEQHLLLFACLVGVVLTQGAQWLRSRRSGEIWPMSRLKVEPAAIRGALSQLNRHLTEHAPQLTRLQRDQARFALGQIDRTSTRLQELCQAGRRSWYRTASPWLTCTHAGWLGVTTGSAVAALLHYWAAGGNHWQASAWAGGCLVLAAGGYLATINLCYRLQQWQRQVVMSAVPKALDELRARLRDSSIPPPETVSPAH